MSLQEFRMSTLLEKQEDETEGIESKYEKKDVKSKKGKGRRIKSKSKK